MVTLSDQIKSNSAAANSIQQKKESNTMAESSPFVQPKLTIGSPDDILEKEADDMADKVMRMPMAEPLHFSSAANAVNRKCAHCEEEEQLQRKEAGNDSASVAPGMVHDVLNSSGKALDSDTRSFMEPRFNYDFSSVKIHTDSVAAKSAQSINALAYTSGNNIVFNAGQYSPGTDSGKRLLSHELTHVVQQKAINPGSIQRQVIPLELRNSIDLSTLTEDELGARLNLILQTLASFASCNAETEMLAAESHQIEAELNIRAGKTFSPEAIDRMKKYHMQNAPKDGKDASHDSCIVALNKGYTKLQNRTAKELKTTPATIEKTMAGMASVGLVGDMKEIQFNDKKGNLTLGTTYPNQLQTSIWDTLITLANGDTGWIVFGLSLMDGNHSVTLTLDNNDPSAPHVYWSDQWGSKKGWKEYDRSGLDNEVTSLIQAWWNNQPANRKFNTVVRVWRLKPYK